MTIHLVTFSDDSMSRSRELCASSAKRFGVDEEWQYEQRHMGASLYVQDHPEVFRPPEDPRRSWGWWAWKPVIILDAMRRAEECFDGKEQLIIYADAGVEFIDNVNYIIDRMDQDTFLFGNMYDHAHWCKRDIVDEVWRFPDDYPHDGYYRISPWEMFGKQVQASVIFFRVNDKTKAFVKEWLDWCLFENGRLIDDSPSRTPNHPEFQENRHDQAILTTMAYRDGYKLHWWPAIYNLGHPLPRGGFTYPRDGYPDEGYPILFHHHRRRNADWEAAA